MMLPIACEQNQLLIYNDALTDKWLIHIYVGTMFMLRNDVYHGGCCGSPGNIRLQVSIIHFTMKDSHSELGHANLDCEFYNRTAIDHTEAIDLLSPTYMNT